MSLLGGNLGSGPSACRGRLAVSGHVEGYARSTELTGRDQEFHVAVRATAHGRSLTVLGEPQTFQANGRQYATPNEPFWRVMTPLPQNTSKPLRIYRLA
jgi:hypothetical protein